MTSTQLTVPYVTTQDRPLPPEQERKLEFKFISRAERLRIQGHFKAAMQYEDERFFEEIRSGVLIALVGWSGFPIPYDPARLDEILSDQDYAELRANLVGHIHAAELLQKSLRRSQQSAQESPTSVTADDSPTDPAQGGR